MAKFFIVFIHEKCVETIEEEIHLIKIIKLSKSNSLEDEQYSNITFF